MTPGYGVFSTYILVLVFWELQILICKSLVRQTNPDEASGKHPAARLPYSYCFSWNEINY